MFGMGWSEMVLIGIVALIVIGPKDLPNLFRAMGQFTGKARAMAREFSRAMEAAADESGVRDITKSIQAAANPQKFGLDKLKEATSLSAPKPAPALKSGELAEAKLASATETLAAERAETRAKISAEADKRAAAKEARAATKAEIAADAEIVAEEAPKPAPRKASAAKAPAKTSAKTSAKADAKAPAKSSAKPRAPRKAKAAPKGDA